MIENLKKNQEDYGTGETQQYVLDILSELDSFFQNVGIEYSLSGGSLLGAIRHKGFIPWDDDIDIMFDRTNYEKFKALSNKLPNDLIVIQDIWVKRITRTDNPDMASGKGCIDLFVFDNVPDGKLMNRIKVFLIQTLQGMLKTEHDYSKYNSKEKVLVFGTWILGLPFTKKFKQRLYDSVSKIGNKHSSNKINVYNTFFKYIKRCKFNSTITENYIDVNFENCVFKMISGYDEYLTEQYGDYMTPPKIQDRKPTHI